MPLFSPDPPILMNEGETGQLKRCTYIREALHALPIAIPVPNYDNSKILYKIRWI